MENEQNQAVTGELIVPEESTSTVLLNSIKSETKADKIAFINALQDPDKKVADCLGQMINVKGIYAESFYSQKRGKELTRVVLIDDENVSYSAVSALFYNSLRAIVAVLGEPSKLDEPIKIQIVPKTLPNGDTFIAKVVE